MATDERKVQLGVGVDATGARQGFKEVKDAARDMAQSVAQSGQAASKGLDTVGSGGDAASKKVDRATKSIIASIQRQTAVLEAGSKSNAKYWETLASQRGVDATAIRPYVEQLEAVRVKQESANAALGRGAIQLNQYGLSAKQTAAAMRGVPAQLTDIFVSLSTGQRPMTVMLQQGGQLKDMFGGIVPAAQALASTALRMVNPLTLAGAAIGGLYLAYRSGASESEEFNKTLILTGNAAGTTTAELQAMAARVGTVVGTQKQAAAALNDFARSSKVGKGNLEDFAAAAIRWEEATGTAVSETVKKFEELAKDPVGASLKLNESMNYLTASVYEQIKALDDAGRHTDAAARAQRAFADAINDRAPQMKEQIGGVAAAWMQVKQAVNGALNAMTGAIGVGQIKDVDDQIRALEERLQAREGRGQAVGNLPQLIEAAKRRREELVKEAGAIREITEAERARSEQLKASISIDAYLSDSSRMSRDEQLQDEIKKEQAVYKQRIADAGQNAELIEKIERAHQTAMANIRDKFKEKGAGGIKTSDTELASLRGRIEAEKALAAQLAATGLAQVNMTEGDKLALQYAEKLKLATNAKTKASLQNNMALAQELGALQRNNAEQKAWADEQRRTIDTVTTQTQALNDQIATYGLGKSAIQDMIIARLEAKRAAEIEAGGSQAVIDGLAREIEARRKLRQSMAQVERLDAAKKANDEFLREWDRVTQQVEQSLTDAIFEGGRSGKELLKDLFKTLTLRVLVQPVVGAMSGTLQGMLGMGPQAGTGGGGGLFGAASNLNSAYNAFSGGLTGKLSNGIGWLGEKFGSTALQTFASGMVGGLPTALGSGFAASLGTSIGTSAASMATTTFSASLGGAGAAGASAAGGAAGMGAAFGAALPWIGGALAIGSLFAGDLFGGGAPRTRHGQRTTVELTNGTFGITEHDDRLASGADAAVLALTRSSVAAANQIFAQAGVDAAIESFAAIMESSIQGDRNGVLSGGKLRIGDRLVDIGMLGAASTQAGFGGWSSEDMMSRLGTDIQLSILEAFQKADVLSSILGGVDIRGLDAPAAQQLTETVQSVVQSAEAFRLALEKMPFENLRDLTLDARAGLISLAGGLDNLLAAQQAYYEAFYTEEERFARQRTNISDALSAVNLAMPQTLAQFRALVDSLDLNAEAGQRAYTTLMAVAPAFAEVVEQAEQAAKQTADAIVSGLTSRDGAIDIDGLVSALADASEQTFVVAMERVFTSLGDRLSRIIDGIASERLSVQQAIRDVAGAGVMTPEAIRAQMAGINTSLPGNAALVAANQSLQAASAQQSAAASALAARQREAAVAGQVLDSANQALSARSSELANAQAYLAQQQSLAVSPATGGGWVDDGMRIAPWIWAEMEPWMRDEIPDWRRPLYDAGSQSPEAMAAQTALPGAQAEVERLIAAQRAAQSAADAAATALANSTAAAQAAASAKAQADQKLEAAAVHARQAQLAYVDALQQFSIDAGKSVSKLSQLRDETMRYYESQRALAELMRSSAEGLRKAAYDYRFSQLDPEAQFRELRGKFDKAYSLALSTDGEALASYAEQMQGLLNPLLDRAADVYGSDQALQSFIATMLARVDNIAGRVDTLAPADYEAESLAVLNQIDATLAALNESASSAERIVVDAINASRDATVDALRQVVNAVAGKPVAAFAAGGYHVGGLRIVGEHGPELEATGPARIFNAAQTRDILSGGGTNAELLAELRRLREEVSDLRAETRATASHTAKTARQLERIEGEGLIVRTDADSPIQTEVVA